MTAISTFLQASAPLIQDDPRTKPFVLQLLQWGLAGFKGADTIEGVIDKAIEVTSQEDQNPKPDPAKQAADNAMALEQKKHENDMELLQAKSQAKLQEEHADMVADMEKRNADLQADLKTISAKMLADIQSEIAQSMANMEQNNAAVLAEIQKSAIETALKIEEIQEAARVRPEPSTT